MPLLDKRIATRCRQPAVLRLNPSRERQGLKPLEVPSGLWIMSVIIS
jgi:hypothetical protein